MDKQILSPRIQRKANISSDTVLYWIIGIIALIITVTAFYLWFNDANDATQQTLCTVNPEKSDCDNDHIIDVVDLCVCDDSSICKSNNKEEIDTCSKRVKESCSCTAN